MRFAPTKWKDYELLDSGNYEKLERFGEVYLIRPETTAVWPPGMSSKEWKNLAHAKFRYKDKKSGGWEKYKPLPSQWNISYRLFEIDLTFKLQLTKFKHVGIFPEHAANWEYIARLCRGIEKQGDSPAKVLNLFAYTGGASLAAKSQNADVTHVDSIRQVISWTKENMESSSLDNIRWVVEDALKFVQREEKRGNKYDGIILDPPSWGLGPKGEKWKLEDQVNELLSSVSNILKPKHFAVVNTYSGLSPMTLKNLVEFHFKPEGLQVGELCLISGTGQCLSLGTTARFENI